MTRLTRISLALVRLFALFLTGASSPTTTEVGRVIRAASMHERRADHTATLLPDGRVLIAGGMVENGVFLNSAELFDPAKGMFAATRQHAIASRRPQRNLAAERQSADRWRPGGPGVRGWSRCRCHY